MLRILIFVKLMIVLFKKNKESKFIISAGSFDEQKNLSLILQELKSLSTTGSSRILIGDSGFASELCLSGWPIILIKSELQPINSPVLDSYIKIFEISKIKNIIDANSSNLNSLITW